MSLSLSESEFYDIAMEWIADSFFYNFSILLAAGILELRELYLLLAFYSEFLEL